MQTKFEPIEMRRYPQRTNQIRGYACIYAFALNITLRKKKVIWKKKASPFYFISLRFYFIFIAAKFIFISANLERKKEGQFPIFLMNG